MKITELTDEQYTELMRIRMSLDSEYSYFIKENKGVFEVEVESKEYNTLGDFMVTFVLKSKRFLDQREYFIFKRLYIKEIQFLQNLGVIF